MTEMPSRCLPARRSVSGPEEALLRSPSLCGWGNDFPFPAPNPCAPWGFHTTQKVLSESWGFLGHLLFVVPLKLRDKPPPNSRTAGKGNLPFKNPKEAI